MFYLKRRKGRYFEATRTKYGQIDAIPGAGYFDLDNLRFAGGGDPQKLLRQVRLFDSDSWYVVTISYCPSLRNQPIDNGKYASRNVPCQRRLWTVWKLRAMIYILPNRKEYEGPSLYLCDRYAEIHQTANISAFNKDGLRAVPEPIYAEWR